jgi:acetate kinase
MTDQLLTLNCGSSSIKFAVYAAAREPALVVRGAITGLGAQPAFKARDASGKPVHEGDAHWADERGLTLESAADRLFAWLGKSGYGQHVVAAGHRVVHGGEHFVAPLVIDDTTLDQLERLDPMAPLHQPHNLAAIRTLRTARPSLKQVACFDTAFHGTAPAVAQHYALPRVLTAAGIRRYGFHGLSYEYIAGELPQYIGRRAEGAVVVAHLGNGASMCAMRNRRSVATTMGFTALEGLVMGTRSGAIDPGVVFYLMRERGMTASQVEHLLYYDSGLRGVSGMSGDMRELLQSPEPRAKEAIDLFVYRASRELVSLAAALSGLEVLVFTGGIGEHAAPVRAMLCEQAHWLGVEIDPQANVRHETLISTDRSRVAVCVVPTDEEMVIARHTARLLGV